MSVPRRSDRATQAFARAVRSELDAIALHEAAALRLEELAGRLESAALQKNAESARSEALATAAQARDRAQAARDRAEAARNRLRRDGIDPDAAVNPESGPAVIESTSV